MYSTFLLLTLSYIGTLCCSETDLAVLNTGPHVRITLGLFCLFVCFWSFVGREIRSSSWDIQVEYQESHLEYESGVQ